MAVILNLFSRKIIGWAMKERIEKQLVIDALRMALGQRKPARGLLHH